MRPASARERTEWCTEARLNAAGRTGVVGYMVIRSGLEVYGPPARLAEVEQVAQDEGLRTRRTGTSVAVLGERRSGVLEGDSAVRRPANLEDVFVLLTGEQVE